jgi:hypothetical protein
MEPIRQSDISKIGFRKFRPPFNLILKTSKSNVSNRGVVEEMHRRIDEHLSEPDHHNITEKLLSMSKDS